MNVPATMIFDDSLGNGPAFWGVAVGLGQKPG